MKLPKKNYLLNGAIEFASRVGFGGFRVESFYDILEQRAEAVELVNPGSGYQHAYHNILNEVFQDMVNNIAQGKSVSHTFEEIISLYDDLAIKPYLEECKKQDVPTQMKTCDSPVVRQKVLSDFKNILDNSVISALDETREKLRENHLTLDNIESYTQSKWNNTPTKSEAITLTAYAMALKEQNKKRSFFEMLGSLRIHIKEKFMIRNMKKLAARSGIEASQLERDAASNGNTKLTEMRDTIASQFEAGKDAAKEYAEQEFEMQFIKNDPTGDLDKNTAKEGNIFGDDFDLFKIKSKDLGEEEIGGREAVFSFNDEKLGNDGNVDEEDLIDEAENEDDLSVIDEDNDEKDLDEVRTSINLDKEFNDLNKSFTAKRTASEDIPQTSRSHSIP